MLGANEALAYVSKPMKSYGKLSRPSTKRGEAIMGIGGSKLAYTPWAVNAAAIEWHAL
jgi:hypothetical protein